LIRSSRTLRADSACWTSDQLTGPERAANSLPAGFVSPDKLTFRDHAMKWADVPEIRDALLKLRVKP
jgi:hypothetical protein